MDPHAIAEAVRHGMFENDAASKAMGMQVEEVGPGFARVSVTSSFGVASLAPGSESVASLIANADAALYVAKQSGRNRFHLFDVGRDQEVKATHQTVERVRQALVAGELCLYYQPKVHMRHGAIVGFEALLRWEHPHKGTVPAREFLPLVAQTDLIIDIGEWVIEQVLQQLSRWQAAGRGWPISVNIAARHFQRADFVDRLGQLLARHAHVPPQGLDLEIVESVAVENIQHVSACLQACQALGVQFSLGDFGTGYSSLSYLKRLRTQTIKIDRSFIRDILHDHDDLALTKAVIGLARAFGRQVIAEGVESIEHGQLLLQLGCDIGQGYFIARPMPEDEVQRWAEQYVAPLQWRLEEAVS